MRDLIIGVAMFAAVAVGYLVWLNAGCELEGVMTWNGKVCIEDIGL